MIKSSCLPSTYGAKAFVVVQAGETASYMIGKAGFDIAWTKTKTSAPSVKERQGDFIKEICSIGSYGLNHGKTQLDKLIHG